MLVIGRYNLCDTLTPHEKSFKCQLMCYEFMSEMKMKVTNAEMWLLLVTCTGLYTL